MQKKRLNKLAQHLASTFIIPRAGDSYVAVRYKDVPLGTFAMVNEIVDDRTVNLIYAGDDGVNKQITVPIFELQQELKWKRA